MRKVIISGMIGNALEWYDFILFALMADIFSSQYFPHQDPSISYIITFSAFAAGFFTRPLGGIFFGYIGDKFGRKIALISSVLMMAIPTSCIGLLPNYASIGIVAPISLTVIRLLQGLALGGGFSGCIAFIVEHAPDNRRGFAGSSSVFSMAAGILLGTLVTYVFSHNLPHEQYQSWGWRVPFLISILIGFVGLYMKNLHESPKYLQAKKNGILSDTPLREIFANYKTKLFIAIGIYITVTIPFFTMMVFMKTFMTANLGHSLKEALFMNAISILVHMAIIPYAGYLSDKIGRKPILIAAAIAFLILTYPVFWMFNQPGLFYPLIGQIIFGAVLAFYIAPMPAMLVEQFPTCVRFTGIALSYNLSAAIFGGTTPSVATWLIKHTGNNYSLAFYIMGFTLISLISLMFYRDRYNKSIV